MPKTTKSGAPDRSELPSTLLRSEEKAQRIFAEAHDSALGQYGDEERAYRVGDAAFEHSYEKVGDHWEPKSDRGPSDQRAEGGGPDAAGRTHEGVNANATKEHLLDVARRLEIRGRSKMTKHELVDAIEKENRRATARARQ
jgi:cation transport regulator ChaB